MNSSTKVPRANLLCETRKSNNKQRERQLQQQDTCNSNKSNKFHNRSPTRVAIEKSEKNQSKSNLRLKSTSMSNLEMAARSSSSQSSLNLSGAGLNIKSAKIERMSSSSRHALDSIHKGMNAKYAQVQSKVLLQNIRPQTNSNVCISGPKLAPRSSDSGAITQIMTQQNCSANQRPIAKQLKSLQDQIEKLEFERQSLRSEIEKEKVDKSHQLNQLKAHLQEKLIELERRNDDQHQKLMEAHQLADQNRQTADFILNESKIRDEQSRQRMQEVQDQLAQIRDFVNIKEQMSKELNQLRQRIQDERQIYEEKIKTLTLILDPQTILSPHQNQLRADGQHSEQIKEQSSANNKNYFHECKYGADHLTGNEEQDQNNIEHRIDENIGACSNCSLKNCKKLHKSQFDLYGSRVSNRVQNSAKVAWKSTKKLASSVFNSGARLNSCRHQTGSASIRVKIPAKKSKVTASNCDNLSVAEAINEYENLQDKVDGQMQAFKRCIEEKSGSNSSIKQKNKQITPQLTSVIKLESQTSSSSSSNVVQASNCNILAYKCESSGKYSTGSERVDNEAKQYQDSLDAPSLIHSDKNNKLTIVTKFSNSDTLNNDEAAAGQLPLGSGTTGSASSLTYGAHTNDSSDLCSNVSRLDDSHQLDSGAHSGASRSRSASSSYQSEFNGHSMASTFNGNNNNIEQIVSCSVATREDKVQLKQRCCTMNR